LAVSHSGRIGPLRRGSPPSAAIRNVRGSGRRKTLIVSGHGDITGGKPRILRRLERSHNEVERRKPRMEPLEYGEGEGDETRRLYRRRRVVLVEGVLYWE